MHATSTLKPSRRIPGFTRSAGRQARGPVSLLVAVLVLHGAALYLLTRVMCCWHF